MTGHESALLSAFVFLSALLYSSVGHGGASAYLATLALFPYPKEPAIATALILNILVSALSMIVYARSKHFRWNLTWPFLLTSVPAAYCGGRLHISSGVYSFLLALALLLAAWRLWVESAAWDKPLNADRVPFYAALPLGAAIGLTSGLIGIGGGVFLSPIILFLGLAGAKETAATSACFILINSVSGLAARWPVSLDLVPVGMWSLIVAALAGGLIGSKAGSQHWSSMTLRKVLGVVLGMAGLKLLHAAL